MINIRHKGERGLTDTGWLQSWHSFSFGEYHDRAHMGFGPLRVINDDVVAPGMGFHTHGHANMEIITIVFSGALEHKDSLGSGGVIRPGDVQVMSAGKGILHSEFNPSPEDPVHLLQIWIMPQETGTRPAYQQQAFDPEIFRNRLGLVVSPDGEAGSLRILQDARIWQAHLSPEARVDFPAKADRKYWLQVAAGEVIFGGRRLSAGDGLALAEEGGAQVLQAADEAKIVLFDLPR